MDDMVILCENKEKAQNILRSITVFLENNLKLTLNSKTRIFKDIQGVNFCGYKINERRMKIRHASKCRMKRKLKKYTQQLKDGKISLSEIQRSIAGWLGYVKHADSYNLRKYSFLKEILSKYELGTFILVSKFAEYINVSFCFIKKFLSRIFKEKWMYI